jgi:hypothetical protein
MAALADVFLIVAITTAYLGIAASSSGSVKKKANLAPNFASEGVVEIQESLDDYSSVCVDFPEFFIC